MIQTFWAQAWLCTCHNSTTFICLSRKKSCIFRSWTPWTKTCPTCPTFAIFPSSPGSSFTRPSRISYQSTTVFSHKKINRNAQRPWLSQQGAGWTSKMRITTKMPKNGQNLRTCCFFSVKPKESCRMTCLKPSNLTCESAVSSVSSQILSQVSCIHTNTWCFSRYPLAFSMVFFGRVTWKNLGTLRKIWKVWSKTWELYGIIKF